MSEACIVKMVLYIRFFFLFWPLVRRGLIAISLTILDKKKNTSVDKNICFSYTKQSSRKHCSIKLAFTNLSLIAVPSLQRMFHNQRSSLQKIHNSASSTFAKNLAKRNQTNASIKSQKLSSKIVAPFRKSNQTKLLQDREQPFALPRNISQRHKGQAFILVNFRSAVRKRGGDKRYPTSLLFGVTSKAMLSSWFPTFVLVGN